MRKALFFLSAVLLVLTACSAAEPRQKLSGAATEVLDSSSYIMDTDAAKRPVREYGRENELKSGGGRFKYSIFYPTGGHSSPDEDIKRWAEDTLSGLLSDKPSELSVSYNSYMVAGRYAAVKELGWYYETESKLSRDIVYTQNIDLSSGELMSAGDIFSSGCGEVLFPLIKKSLEDKAEGLSFTVDEGWLKYPVLTDDGLELVLPKGEFLPSELGTITLRFPYEGIQREIRAELSGHEDAPEQTGQTAEPENEPALRYGLDPGEPMIALTFDDGPGAATAHILDLLSEYNARATFCIVGNRIEKFPDTVKRVIEEGSEIACHTWSHTRLQGLSEEDIRSQISRIDDTVFELTGFEVKFLRPPYGKVTDGILAAAQAEGVAVVNWSVDTDDWRTKDPASTFNAIKRGAADGAVILCHDLYRQTGEAMEEAIPWLCEEGYRLVTLSELCYYKLGGTEAGVLYK